MRVISRYALPNRLVCNYSQYNLKLLMWKFVLNCRTKFAKFKIMFVKWVFILNVVKKVSYVRSIKRHFYLFYFCVDYMKIKVLRSIYLFTFQWNEWNKYIKRKQIKIIQHVQKSSFFNLNSQYFRLITTA